MLGFFGGGFEEMPPCGGCGTDEMGGWVVAASKEWSFSLSNSQQMHWGVYS